jgi:hypothetical protein
MAVSGDAERQSPPKIDTRRLFMAANAISTHDFTVNHVNTTTRASESCAPVTLKQRFEKLLSEVFEGHEEYLGATPD